MHLEKLEIVRNKLLALLLLEEDIIYISNKEADYFEAAVSNSLFLYRCYKNNIKLLTIDLCKILNKNENGNIISLVDDYIRHYDEITWMNPLPMKELNDLQNKLTEIISSEEFKRMKNARDKYYAHDDVNKSSFKTNVEFDKIWAITNELQEIFNRLYFCHQNSTQWFNFTQKPSELQSLFRYQKLRELVINEFEKDRNSINFEKFMKIIRGETV